MKKFKCIEVTLENSEYYIIPAKCIDRMNVDGFKKKYYIQGDYGDCSTSLRAYSFLLSVKNLKDIKAYWEWSKPFSERIFTGGDITAVAICYEDNSNFTFYVPWNYKNDQSNSWQTVRKNQDESMKIEIKKPRDIRQ